MHSVDTNEPPSPPPSAVEETLFLRTLGTTVAIRCADAGMRALLAVHYGSMRAGPAPPHLRCTVTRAGGAWSFTRDGLPPLPATDPGQMLLLVDQDLIVGLQMVRRDLYFVHAAVLERAGHAVMLVAESGGGKSTTAWALLHHGFRYLSDELAPVDVITLAVHPYPRALTLKAVPPAPYRLPRATRSTSRGIHVPTEAFPDDVRGAAARVGAIFFLHYRPEPPAPAAERISAGQAGARLYANALNPLAHAEEGLDGAIRIAETTACFALAAADLSATCALVKEVVDGVTP